MSDLDPIDFQVINNNISGIAQEMQERMYRSAYSTIIRESLDASCAILDADGHLVGQHVILPLHMGAFPPAVDAILEAYDEDEIEPGDAFMTNHPYLAGAPHQPDMAIISPVFFDGEIVAYCCNMAHKSDVGGMVPGSGSGQATEIYQEGIHFPPVRFYRGGELAGDVERIIRENSRTPDIVLGDMHAQVGTNEIGRERLGALFDKHGKETMEQVFEEIFDSTERRLRAHIEDWNDGVAEAEGYLDDDGVNIGDPIRLHVEITVEDDDITFDFTGTQDQTEGPVNICPPMVRACCYYALIAMTDHTIPNSYGLARAIDTEFRAGSAVNPESPAPVNCYIIPAQRMAETILLALQEFTDEQAVAATGGDGAIVLGGTQPSSDRSYSHYEIFGSAYGARQNKDGVSCVDVHIGNCKITPIEVVEAEFPVQITEFDLLPDSGGAGQYRGGLGFRRTYRLLEGSARFSKRDDRQEIPPQGLAGGEPGKTGATVVNPETDAEESLPSKFGDYQLEAGDVFRIDRAGGGGYGNPVDREIERVLEDVKEGYVTTAAAKKEYGVAIEAEEGDPEVDYERTRELRQ
jgi:N-methylhydantoinase B